MARLCTTCSHPERAAIDRELVGNGSKRRIAAKYGIPARSLHRHAVEHLPEWLRIAAVGDEIAEAKTLRARVERMVGHAERLLEDSAAVRHGAAILAAIRELRPSLELLGRATGELKTEPAGIQALFMTLGVRGEDEIRSALDLARAEPPSLEQGRDRALEVLRWVLQREPAWTGEVLAALGVGDDPSSNGGG